MNVNSQTLKAFLQSGVSSDIANKIIEYGFNFQSFAAATASDIGRLGLETDIKNKIYNNRPKIPEKIIDNLLYKSNRTCCICKESKRSIIIHHINEWNISKDNSEDNLVVLCLEHHDDAHTIRELSQNLTPERIRTAKQKWQTEVEKKTNIIFSEYLSVFTTTTDKQVKLKEKWYNFLRRLSINVEIITDSTERYYVYDFKLVGIEDFYIKIFDIKSIDELVNKEELIKELPKFDFFSNTIILGRKPFVSKNGYWGGETYIQLGWIYSYGGDEWDNLMLKDNYDISNSFFYIQNLLYSNDNWKDFMSGNLYDEIMEDWK